MLLLYFFYPTFVFYYNKDVSALYVLVISVLL